MSGTGCCWTRSLRGCSARASVSRKCVISSTRCGRGWQRLRAPTSSCRSTSVAFRRTRGRFRRCQRACPVGRRTRSIKFVLRLRCAPWSQRALDLPDMTIALGSSENVSSSLISSTACVRSEYPFKICSKAQGLRWYDFTWTNDTRTHLEQTIDVHALGFFLCHAFALVPRVPGQSEQNEQATHRYCAELLSDSPFRSAQNVEQTRSLSLDISFGGYGGTERAARVSSTSYDTWRLSGMNLVCSNCASNVSALGCKKVPWATRDPPN